MEKSKVLIYAKKGTGNICSILLINTSQTNFTHTDICITTDTLKVNRQMKDLKKSIK